MTENQDYLGNVFQVIDKGNQTYYFMFDVLEVDIYLEHFELRESEADDYPRGWKAGEDCWNVGVFDRTIASHPTIPSTHGQYRRFERAIGHALGIAVGIVGYVTQFRASEPYQNAVEVAERAPPFSDGNADDKLPGFLVRQQQSEVFGGRKKVNEAVAELYDKAKEEGVV